MVIRDRFFYIISSLYIVVVAVMLLMKDSITWYHLIPFAWAIITYKLKYWTVDIHELFLVAFGFEYNFNDPDKGFLKDSGMPDWLNEKAHKMMNVNHGILPVKEIFEIPTTLRGWILLSITIIFRLAILLETTLWIFFDLDNYWTIWPLTLFLLWVFDGVKIRVDLGVAIVRWSKKLYNIIDKDQDAKKLILQKNNLKESQLMEYSKSMIVILIRQKLHPDYIDFSDYVNDLKSE